MEEIFNSALLVSAGIAVILTPVMQAVKNLGSINNKHIPFVSWTVGIVVGVLWAVIFKENIALYGLAGLMAGFGSNGIYDGLQTKKGAK